MQGSHDDISSQSGALETVLNRPYINSSSGNNESAFELGDLVLGVDSRHELIENFREAMQMLAFRFSHKVKTNYE